MNGFMRKNVLILTLGLLFCSASTSADMYADNTAVMHTVSEKMHVADTKNTCLCPIGPAQILHNLALITKDVVIKKEIDQFLEASPSPASCSAFAAALTKKNKESDHLSIGQYLLVSNTLKLKTEHTALFKSLTLSIQPVDYNDPEVAANTINKIVQKDTKDQIKEIVSMDDFSGNPCVLTLLTTFYVEQNWVRPFGGGVLNFKKADHTEKKNIPSFQKDEIPLRSRITDQTISVIIDAHNDVFLFAHLDHSGLLTPVTKTVLDTFLDENKVQNVDFKMPTFEIETTLNLKECLGQHLPQLFGGSKFTLDFFESTPEVQVGAFRQKNKIQVTKTGVKGASATMMIIRAACFVPRAVVPLKAWFNKPFTYGLFKTVGKNHIPLFVGQVTNPLAAPEYKEPAYSDSYDDNDD